MADIELVIKIPEKDYDKLSRGELIDTVCMSIKNGVPLPKGYGRLIDAGEYLDVLNNAQIEGLNTYKGLGRAKELLIEAPTIIEADKEQE